MNQPQPPLFGRRQKRPPRVKGVKTKAGQRSLAYLRKAGYTAEVCEQFKARVQGSGQAAIFAGGFRKDLFGFADIMAFDTDGVLAVLRWSDLSAPQLALILAGRFAAGTVRRAVLELRRLGEVVASGRWTRWPGRAKEWRLGR